MSTFDETDGEHISDSESPPVSEGSAGRQEGAGHPAPASKARRRFINGLIGGGFAGWLGTILYPVAAFLNPPDVPEANVNSVKAGLASTFEAHSSEIIQFGRTPVILVRLETGEFRAFSGTCTHLDCIVQFRGDIEHIWCACHNGHYDLNGRNLSGPPPDPLTAFLVNVVDDEIIISKPPQVA
jgi:Rieske Fe-S protein